MDLTHLLQTYSAPIALFIWGIFKLIDYGQARGKVQIESATVDNKQDDTLTNFSIKFDARNEQLVAENKELSTRLHSVELAQAEQKGRETAREEAHERDRLKWEAEKNILTQEIQDLKNRLGKFELQDKVKDTLVSELEAELDSKRTGLAVANEMIATLNIRITEQDTQVSNLTSDLEKERYKSQGLSELVAKIQVIDAVQPNTKDDNTIPLSDALLDAVEDTYIPEIEE